MKKKIFFQKSLILFILLLVCGIMFAGAIFVIVSLLLNINKANNISFWLLFLVIVFVAVYLGYTIIRLVRNRIIFTEEKLYVPENWGGKDVKFQYKVIVDFTEIKEVFITESCNNSLNKAMPLQVLPMPYIVIECKNGKQKAINVFYYSKKQTIKIIETIIEYSKLNNNIFTLKTAEQIFAEYISNKKQDKKS